MAVFYLLMKRDSSQGSLARKLCAQLDGMGVHYHIRTIKRQLSGEVATIPVSVQDVMRDLLLRDTSLQTWRDVTFTLWSVGLSVTSDRLHPRYVSTQRIRPLVQLWLILNPNRSRRALAVELSRRLANCGVKIKVNPLEVIFGGRQSSSSREVLDELLILLGEHGIETEDEAVNDPAQLIDLGWVRAPPIASLAQRWLAESPGISIRQLAIRVAQTAQKMGYSTSHNTIQPILAGHKKKARGFVYRAMLKQFQDHDERVPVEHILPSRWLEASLPVTRVACLSAKKGENYATQQSTKRRPVIRTKSRIITRNPAPRSSGQWQGRRRKIDCGGQPRALPQTYRG
jgi:hypothetical protein